MLSPKVLFHYDSKFKKNFAWICTGNVKLNPFVTLVCFGHTSSFKNAQKKGCGCVRQEDRLSCFGCIFYALKLQYDGTVHCLEGRQAKVVANVAWRAVECEH